MLIAGILLRHTQGAPLPLKPKPQTLGAYGVMVGLYWGYMGRMEKKMDTTGIIGVIYIYMYIYIYIYNMEGMKIICASDSGHGNCKACSLGAVHSPK